VRVLHVINSFETGGAQTLVEALCQVSTRGNETHVVVLLGPDTLSGRIENAADSVSYLKIRKDPLSAAVGVLRLRRIIRRLRPDVIHSHLLQSDLIAALAKGSLPLISTVHTSGGHESGASSALVTRAMRFVAHRYAALVACSPSAAQFARSTVRRHPDSTILNGTRLSATFTPTVPGADRFLLSLARWHPMKDHANLLAALDQMGEAAPRLVCAGAGMSLDNAELGALIGRFPNVDVELCGPVGDVTDLIRRATALVLSSSHGEALPMAGIESLGAGVPVVTTDVGDCALLALDASCLVPPRDPAALATAIAILLSKEPEAELDLRAQARRRAEELFDVMTAARSYAAIYQKVAL